MEEKSEVIEIDMIKTGSAQLAFGLLMLKL